VLGFFWDYVPEELIHAAGFLPYRILGSTESISEADRHIQSFVCTFMRSALDQALKGSYAYMDGIVLSPFWCEAMKPLWDIWKAHAPSPWMEALDLPGITEPAGRPYFAREMLRFKAALEGLAGEEISEAALGRSIRLYNEGRRLLQRLFHLRQSRLPFLSSTEWAQVVLSSMVMPKEEHNRWLRGLVEALEAAPEGDTGRVRLHLTGSILIDLNFLRLIEEVGGVITSDDLYTGTRWYWDLVDEGLAPMEGIIQRYWEKLPCPCRSMPRVRLGQILDFLRLGRGQGVVFFTEKHCDPHIFEDPLLGDLLRERGIPTLHLDTELALRGAAQVRTRLQTFVEVVSQGERP
jgi:benzoyl-CoA reductase subunit C